ncbi:Na+/H+ antiporter NhaA [bacterium M21]|nr:Na+/H+ antiporter NhaA [bacterium M21]
MLIKWIKNFFKQEAAGGILLLIMAVLAITVRNIPALAEYYEGILHAPVHFTFGPLHYDPAHHMLGFINDGLMAIFFLLVGMEVKREIVQGELSKVSQMVLPGVAAVGGMVAPAAVFVVINLGNPTNLAGWAIPSATDIAFALGVLSLFGKRVPVALKMFLMTLAVLDDLGAVIIIALFYSGNISMVALGTAAGLIALLYLFNRAGVVTLKPYLWVGLFLWLAMEHSGLHATLAGVILAFMIPLKRIGPSGVAPLVRLGHELHVLVTFGVLPLFAFVNAGVPFEGTSMGIVVEPVTLGIMGGLFFGKQAGVFMFTWVGVKLKLVSLPKGVTWPQFYGVCMLCGIGFTMSLFLGGLAFPTDNPAYADPRFIAGPRVGILIGSLVSAVGGYLLLNLTLDKGKLPPKRRK